MTDKKTIEDMKREIHELEQRLMVALIALEEVARLTTRALERMQDK